MPCEQLPIWQVSRGFLKTEMCGMIVLFSFSFYRLCLTLASAMSLPPKTVYALLQQVLKDPEIGPGAILETKKQCPGLHALISQTKKKVVES